MISIIIFFIIFIPILITFISTNFRFDYIIIFHSQVLILIIMIKFIVPKQNSYFYLFPICGDHLSFLINLNGLKIIWPLDLLSIFYNFRVIL